MKTTMKCPMCGQEFTRIHSASKPPVTCSRSCANKMPGRMTLEIRAKISEAVHAERHPNWKGGSWVDDYGTTYIRVPDSERGNHPTMRPDGYIRRYHYVWNQAHPDDPVRLGEVIHHLNENHQDDRIQNLEKTVQSKHATGHGLGRVHSPDSRSLMSQEQLKRRSKEREQRSAEWLTEFCGTSKGYMRHYAAGETACRPCLDAHASATYQSRNRIRD